MGQDDRTRKYYILNLLRNSRVNPKLSAYAYAYGEFDFNKTPLCPPGAETVVHLKPKTIEDHGASTEKKAGQWNFP